MFCTMKAFSKPNNFMTKSPSSLSHLNYLSMNKLTGKHADTVLHTQSLLAQKLAWVNMLKHE